MILKTAVVSGISSIFSDTVSRVIQPRARRAPRSTPEPSVNNFVTSSAFFAV
jgi:hypothetical protein